MNCFCLSGNGGRKYKMVVGEWQFSSYSWQGFGFSFGIRIFFCLNFVS